MTKVLSHFTVRTSIRFITPSIPEYHVARSVFLSMDMVLGDARPYML